MNIKDIKKEDLPKGVTILPNGQMDVEISFDITSHGHNFGASRGYDSATYGAMVNDSNVQETIKNGYAKGYFGHHNRNSNAGYLPSEIDTDGNSVEPICRTTAMSISGNIITHKQRIFNTDDGVKIQKLILNGGVGFSSVHNLKGKKFFGMDAVVSGNMSGNRVIVDSICSDGSCKFDSFIDDTVLDAVGVDAPEEIREIAKDLLMHSQEVQDTLKIRKHIKGMKANLDDATSENKTLQDTIDSNKNFADTTNNKLEILIHEMQNIQTQKDDIQSKFEEKLVELDNIKKQLDSFDITIKYDGTLIAPEIKLDGLFSQGDFNKSSKIDKDSIQMIELKKERTPIVGEIDFSAFSKRIK